MDANNSQNSAENKSLDELDISSFSSATGMDPKEEKIRKLEAKLKQIKEANSNQVGGTSMMQMGWQFGKKFDKMEKEMDGLKSANQEGIREFGELKAKMAKMEKKMKKIEAKNAELEGQIAEKNEEIQGLAEENCKMKSAKDEEKAKLKGLKAKMGKMKEELAEKLVEFEGKMRESLEQKADKEEVIQFKNNKWNAANCGRRLFISEDGFVVTNTGPAGNSIRAILPIPSFNVDSTNPSIAGYYEVQIINEQMSYGDGDIRIGFCTRQFPLEGNWLGEEENLIGIYGNAGMYIDGHFNKFGNNAAKKLFKSGDVAGLGIIHSPANKSMKCFATCNGQLLGTLELPDHFSSLQLYPAATLYRAKDSIRANFGQQKFRYDPSQLLK